MKYKLFDVALIIFLSIHLIVAALFLWHDSFRTMVLEEIYNSYKGTFVEFLNEDIKSGAIKPEKSEEEPNQNSDNSSSIYYL